MVAIKSHEADRFLARDVAGFSAYLVHGSDGGLVSERVRALTRALVDDPADPFQLVRLGGDEVASDPGRLADETMTVPLFGGRRAILIDAGSKNIVPALEHHLSAKDPAPVVIEAGTLRKDAPLRKACERAKNAVAVECYPDEERDLARLIEAEVAAAGLRIEPEARQTLLGLLGADRLASRSELTKLALYAHGQGAITADDIEAVVADASAVATDAVVDAAFSGDLAALDVAGRRILAGPVEAGLLLGAALRHAVALHRARLEIAGGTAPDQALATSMRGLSFKRKPAVERQLRAASVEALGRAVVRLGEAVGRARREPTLAQSIALRTLWTVALSLQPRNGR